MQYPIGSKLLELSSYRKKILGTTAEKRQGWLSSAILKTKFHLQAWVNARKKNLQTKQRAHRRILSQLLKKIDQFQCSAMISSLLVDSGRVVLAWDHVTRRPMRPVATQSFLSNSWQIELK